MQHYAAQASQRRAQQQLQWLDEAVREGLLARFYAQAGPQLAAVRAAVAVGRLSPWAGAEGLLGGSGLAGS